MKNGFALLIAVIFMSVMLAFGLTLGSIAYKQQVLASSAIASQYAFYTADAALECMLYADQQLNLFAYNGPTTPLPTLTCPGTTVTRTVLSQTADKSILRYRVSYTAEKRCADVTIYKPSVTTSGTVYLFSQGYDATCTTVANSNGARFVSRGLSAQYDVNPSIVATPAFVASAVDDGSSYNSNDTGPKTFAYPTSAASGDLLVLFVNSMLTPSATPAGWTLYSSYVMTWPPYGYGYAVYTKIKGAENSVAYYTRSGGAHLLVYRFASGIGNTSGWTEASNGPTLTIPSVTPLSSNSVIVGYVSDRDPGGTPSPPSLWTTRDSTGFTFFSNNVSERAFNSADSTGPQTWNVVNASHSAVGVMVEILP